MSAAARALLREARLRATAPRLAVLAVLESARAPLSHAEVHEQLPSTADRATTWRNLTSLAEAGLLLRRDHGDHIWRYELKRAEDHAHFHCTGCGTTSCLPPGAVQFEVSAELPRSVAAAQVEIELHGLCDACQELAGGLSPGG